MEVVRTVRGSGWLISISEL